MNQKMKWTVLLAMLLAALIPCAALAAQGDANIARSDDMREKFDDTVNGGCVCGDTLYFYGMENFFTYRIGDADLTAVKYELPETGSDEYRGIQKLFSDGKNLYALCALSYYRDGESGVTSVDIYPVEVGADEVRFGDPVQVNRENLIASYGDENYEYFVQVNDACFVNGYLMMYVYNQNGEEAIYSLDTESGEGSYLEDIQNIRSMTPYADGELLIETYDYEAGKFAFLLYDPESEALRTACEPLKREDGWYSGLAYSRESGRLFYMANGYVNAVENFDFENAEQVAELSTFYYSESGAMLLPGDYYVYVSYEGTSIRATDPGAMPDTRLTVRGAGYSDSIMSAYYNFGNTHGDVAVVLDQNYNDSDIIESMMGKDDSVDIYMLSVSSEAFDALYNRGYMVELENPQLVSAVEEMYPAIQDVLTRDGSVVAIPVSVYSWTLGLDYEGFEKLGIAREDVPDNWSELLDLLPELADKLPEDGRVRLFSDYMTQNMARMDLINGIMESWRIHQVATGREVDYAAPELAELFDKVMALDFEALGVSEEEEEDRVDVLDYRVYEEGGDSDRDYTLIETSVGCIIGSFYSNAEPALLSVIPGEPGEIPLRLSVAFVNPYSKNVELAQEFLVELMNNMEDRTAYNLSDKLNEPVRNRYSVQAIEEYQKELEEQREKLEAAEPVDKPAIEQYIASIERNIEEVDRYSWDIPEKDITWYRERADRLVVDRFDFLDAADDDGELSDLSQQFLAGKVSPADFLKEVDRKVRMRAKEGL